MPISLETATVLSTVLESILYGFSVLMFIGTIWAVTYKHRMPDGNRPMAALAIILLILSSAHVVLGIIRFDVGMVQYHYGPAMFFSDASQETYMIKNAIYILQTLLGDGAVIYRCYVVWQSVRIIILPITLWCSSAVTGISTIYGASQIASSEQFVVVESGSFFTAFIVSTLSTHLLSSGLLVYRIWKTERNVSQIRITKRSKAPVLRMLLDSGIYCVALICILICFVRLNNGQYVVVDMLMPITSISFYAVLMRIAVSRRKQARRKEEMRHYPMQPLQVRISQSKHDVELSSTDRHRLSTEKKEVSYKAFCDTESYQNVIT